MKILVLNTLGCHLGYLGCYGNEWVATPNLDRLAAEGVVFDRHIAAHLHSQTTLASASPLAWHRTAVLELEDLNPTRRDVAASLSADLAWVEGPNLAPPWKLPDDLLGLYTADSGLEPWPDPPGKPASEPQDRRRVRETYAAVVTSLDAHIGELLNELDRRGALDDRLIVFTASTGLALGEHGRVGGESLDLHEELVHLPLVMRFPGGEHGGSRVSAFTQPADVLVTLAGLVGIEPVSGHGHDLLPLLRGDIADVRPYAVTIHRGAGVHEAAIRTPRWALLISLAAESSATTPPRLYVKPDDRWEMNDVAHTHPDLVEALRTTLLEYLAAPPGHYPPSASGIL